MRAVGYFSEWPLSSEERLRPPSLSDQNDGFLRYCEGHGYEPTASFLDSTLEGDRAGFQQLLAYLSRPDRGFLVVVVAGFLHLGLTPTEAVRAYYQLSGLGAKVASVTEGDLDDTRIVELWSVGNPQEERSERVRSAMQRRAVKGQALGRPPYGYRVGPDRRLETVENEAALVRYIFRLYLQEGLGIRLIAKRLNEEGFRTRRNGNWSMVTIRDLLRNRAYLGTYARFGVKVPGSHPALVSEADLHAVAARMARRRPAAAGPRQPGRFLLSGLVQCEACGNRMIGVSRRQRWRRGSGEVVSQAYRYYQCESRTNQSICAYHTRRADELEAAVLQHLTGEVEGAVRRTVIAAGNADAVAAETAAAAERVRGRLRALDRRLADGLAQVTQGRLSRERLRAMGAELAEEHRVSQSDLMALGQRAAAQASEAERRKHQYRQIERIRSEWESLSFAARQALLRELVEAVMVSDTHVSTVLRP